MPTYRTTYLKDFVEERIVQIYRACRGIDPPVRVDIRQSDRPELGDFSTNIAMIVARKEGISPRQLADELVEEMARGLPGEDVAGSEAAGPGFINVFLTPDRIQRTLGSILSDGAAYGKHDEGGGRKIQIEFVSSNPTGPLTVGHGRQAVLGDVLATLYAWLGYDVQREYYFNDEGRQIDLLAESLWVRYREEFGESREIPEDGYRGEYLIPVAQGLKRDLRRSFPRFDDEAKGVFRRAAVDRMTEEIKDDLHELGVRFDHWFSEADLHHDGKVDAALAALRECNGVYEKDGADWLKAEEYGGAKDSVLRRSGEVRSYTYLMVDIAYHIDKRGRGFERVINVQGADHHAEQTCVKAALRILGYPEDFLDYASHQFVSLKEGGETLKMSTRAGRFVTLRGLIDELGRDVVRYFMISRKPEAHLDFDLDLARAESLDNPATYVQYAHTRIASIFRKAETAETNWADVDLTPLVEAEELELIKALDRFPEIVRTATHDFAPHLLAEYALNLSRSFHAYYDKHRVLTDDEPRTQARLAMLHALQTVLGNSLHILGMTAPVEM